MEVDEITKEDARYFAQFFKPLPENYEPVDTGVYLVWTTSKGIVRYYVSQHCVKDFVYWLDLTSSDESTSKKDDIMYDPTIDDVQKLLDWLTT